jgi:Transposase
MHSMKHHDTLVIGGVDSHADTHHAAAMDQRGALLATKGFPTTTPGYRALLDWLCAFGEVDVVAVESTGSYAAALVRYLREHVWGAKTRSCVGSGRFGALRARSVAVSIDDGRGWWWRRSCT